jgi:ABC-2 type transport system ATP-binding protein
MIETTDLTKRYGDVTAVEGLDLEVDRGEIHGFVGPNGAGKTTTMQMLVGLIDPTGGEAYVDGEPAGSIAAKQAIGYAPQDPAFYESMTGRGYLEYMGRTAGMDGDVRDRADELLEWLELSDAANQAVEGYSGGMKRRLGLAQAMIHEPDLLILDEPTAELDPSGRQAIIESLEDLTEEGMTVFVSSHVLAELEQFIDTVTILYEGQLVESGAIEDVQSKYGGESFAVETSDDERVHTLLDGQPWVRSVELDEDGLVVASDDPDRFRTELQGLLADEAIMLQSLQEAGGLEEAFADVVASNGDVDGDRGEEP